MSPMLRLCCSCLCRPFSGLELVILFQLGAHTLASLLQVLAPGLSIKSRGTFAKQCLREMRERSAWDCITFLSTLLISPVSYLLNYWNWSVMSGLALKNSYLVAVTKMDTYIQYVLYFVRGKGRSMSPAYLS